MKPQKVDRGAISNKQSDKNINEYINKKKAPEKSRRLGGLSRLWRMWVRRTIACSDPLFAGIAADCPVAIEPLAWPYDPY